ncbi:hypothetical protein VTP01DRAFT_674 [Rhizomucor pusillus]|uniref:uncharacterized protein n=1 Tax=Rhizomucor pusillus TaxID=4840 RepID=UPI00374464EA
MTYSTLPPQDYLRTLGAIRDRCYQVYEKAQNGQLCYFEVDESKLGAAVDHVAELTRRRFSDLNSIPPHSRLRHFDETFGEWRQKAQQRNDNVEFARKLVDIVVVSVLLDAGAGQEWKYTTHYGKKVGRSEGLAIASVDMFLGGYFSSDDTDRVDAQGLEEISVERMAQGFQVTTSNPMVGLEGRSQLLGRLATVLREQKEYFPPSNGLPSRPGNIIDYLLKDNAADKALPIEKLWKAVMSLGGIWPARIEIDGVQLGDVWPCDCLDATNEYANLVPFHKLSQWLTYSLIEAIEISLGLKIEGVDQMTGLPEYRNGGLLIDYGILKIKPEHIERGGGSETKLPTFEGKDPLIVEWRALTVVYLDKIHKELEKKLNQKLRLAQVLESGTWTAGREIAAKLRPETAGPPIVIQSDGTIF